MVMNVLLVKYRFAEFHLKDAFPVPKYCGLTSWVDNPCSIFMCFDIEYWIIEILNDATSETYWCLFPGMMCEIHVLSRVLWIPGPEKLIVFLVIKLWEHQSCTYACCFAVQGQMNSRFPGWFTVPSTQLICVYLLLHTNKLCRWYSKSPINYNATGCTPPTLRPDFLFKFMLNDHWCHANIGIWY
jgi:hypothetical protein